MPKERSVNPVQAQKKAEKQRQLQRQKKQVQTQRNEKLARRNPERLQRQIDELKELESRSALRPKDKETLAQLEKDVRGIRRAREALGDAAPSFGSGGGAGREGNERKDSRMQQSERRERQQQQGPGGHLGKRRRGEEGAYASDASDSGGDTDPEVRAIPMPRDTPPPIPREFFTDGSKRVVRPQHELPKRPARQAQTTYSSAPQMRDLKKEAVRFMPSAVAQQRRKVKGEGGRLLEPEEIDRLEKAGYYDAKKATEAADQGPLHEREVAGVRAQQGGDADMEEEMRRYEAEIEALHGGGTKVATGPGKVVLEEVEDEGD
ncbi:hypothetical protein K431DRAFT_287801 [Polychaeton citri CBS 116435]|uniref:Wbp11/ELF5/Saf1 N-terminal domain-containing protein n=1 Tax=Polychaeton citri CBS 116435 TaxID=1314669 RepID=A0A9P4Q5B3_9PEZI|nr:hypothetical protein K431DRAFT_287801 [Polychaeton citri CBS 116435]